MARAAALAISDIPFQHVLAGVRVGLVNGKLEANPSYNDTKEAKLSIIVAGTEEGIVMVEAAANEASEDDVLRAIEFGHNCCKTITAKIQELVKLTRQDQAGLQHRRCRMPKCSIRFRQRCAPT